MSGDWMRPWVPLKEDNTHFLEYLGVVLWQTRSFSLQTGDPDLEDQLSPAQEVLPLAVDELSSTMVSNMACLVRPSVYLPVHKSRKQQLLLFLLTLHIVVT